MTGKISDDAVADPTFAVTDATNFAAELAGINKGPSGSAIATYFATKAIALINKTIDAASNTISNLTTAMFASGVVDTDGTLAANSDTKFATQKAVKTYVVAQRSSFGLIIGGFAKAVNFNSVADVNIAISSPTTNYRIQGVFIVNNGTTASLTTAKFGIFSAAGGTGVSIINAATAMTGLTSNAANTSNSATNFATSISAFWNLANLFFRITTAQGAAASGDVYILIQPLP